MAKRISIIAIGAALIALLAVGLASGARSQAGPTEHHFVLTARAAYLKTTAGYPSPGGRSLQAGASTTKLGGEVRRGATKSRIEVLAINPGPVVEFKGTDIAYDRSGSSKARFHGTATFHQDGSATVTGKGRFVGGSGAYRGATGKLTLTGALPELPTVGTIIELRAEGTISY